MNITKWNKIDEINGVDASHFMSNHPEFKNSEVFLVADDYGQVQRIESVNTIKSSLKLDPSATFEEVIEEYRLKVLETEI